MLSTLHKGARMFKASGIVYDIIILLFLFIGVPWPTKSVPIVVIMLVIGIIASIINWSVDANEE